MLSQKEHAFGARRSNEDIASHVKTKFTLTDIIFRTLKFDLFEMRDDIGAKVLSKYKDDL